MHVLKRDFHKVKNTGKEKNADRDLASNYEMQKERPMRDLI